MINFTTLFANKNNKPICKVGILGANGGFGYTFLAQARLMKKMMELRVVCDRDSTKSIALLKEMGYEEENLHVCTSITEVENAPQTGIVVLNDDSLFPSTDCDVLVEATGNPEGSALHAEQCLLSGKHVVMVSKEADVVAGPYLFRLAKSKGLVYTLALGDQPANLINWISYIQTLGLEIICAGKSSEYDFIYDIDTGRLQYRDQRAMIPELKKYCHLGNDKFATLKARSELLKAFPQFAVPDYNEMNVISNVTRLRPSCPRLHYPIINVSELADVYALKEDGGIIDKPGVLDTFNCFHRPDEVSFAGGVFVIVKCHNKKVFGILADKGHVVSKNHDYAALYLPYHYMGVEAPMSVLQAYYLGLSGYQQCNPVCTMVCKTERNFHKGETMELYTHHRCLKDVYVTYEIASSLPKNVAPYYLVAEKKLLRDIPVGTIITQDMLDLSQSNLKRMIDQVKECAI